MPVRSLARAGWLAIRWLWIADERRGQETTQGTHGGRDENRCLEALGEGDGVEVAASGQSRERRQHRNREQAGYPGHIVVDR